MGFGNSQHTVCEKRIALLKLSGHNIRFCQQCNLHMWQHCIRGQYHSRRQASTANQDILARKMYLVRPDGTPWSADWDRVVLPRVRRAVESRASQLLGSGLPDGKRGIVSVDDEGKVMWPVWSRGFLHPDWNASDFSEETGWRLLAQMVARGLVFGDEDDGSRQRVRGEEESPEDRVQMQVREQSPSAIDRDEGEADQQDVDPGGQQLDPNNTSQQTNIEPIESDEQPQHRLDEWLDNLSMADDNCPSTILPNESASLIGASTRQGYPRPLPLATAAPTSPPRTALLPSISQLHLPDHNNSEETIPLSHYRTSDLFNLLNSGMDDLQQAHLGSWHLTFQAVVAAAAGDAATTTNLREAAREISTARVAKARSLALVEREIDLRFYDAYIGGNGNSDVRDVLLRCGVTRAALPWAGKRWKMFVWMDMKGGVEGEEEEEEEAWPGWNASYKLNK